MRVIMSEGTSEKLPNTLAELLRDEGIRFTSGPPHQPCGWTGGHPFKTNFSRPFTAVLAPGEQSIAIPMPSIMAARSRPAPAVVAAHIDIHAELGVGPEQTFSVPNVRDLAGLLTASESVRAAFHRPTSSGRVLGVRADSHEVHIFPVSQEAVFKQLVNGPGWSCQQGENGRFVSRLIERFGGGTSTAGNQPAIAAILDEATRSPHGLPLPRLIQAAKDRQGAWPLLGDRDSYPKQMVYELLKRKLLLPDHRIKCPACSTETTVRPEDLAVEFTCEMCSEVTPLGLALGLKGTQRNDWVYRLAGNVSAERIREVMPIMATFATLSMSQSAPSPLPHIFGLEISAPQSKCEIDLTLCLNDRGLPIIVIGEIKSYRDAIDATDVANLHGLQRYLRSKGIECVILIATGRESLTDEEQTTIRTYCHNLPNPLHRHDFAIPLMPIVLTGQELAAPPYTEKHPQSWPSLEGWRGVMDLAAESCRRNLGEFQASQTDTGSWQLTWPENPTSPRPQP